MTHWTITVASLTLVACGASGSGPSSNQDGGPAFGFDGGTNIVPANCINLECKQHNRGTRITGVVYGGAESG